ncbi:hypothetical protein [Micromonospora sp. DT233]|uniref:hypothetical protein n=1 Tax=Micromonospora sp. DT233 TaxID=3393432 RepID=UPI003CEDE5B4
MSRQKVAEAVTAWIWAHMEILPVRSVGSDTAPPENCGGRSRFYVLCGEQSE